MSNKSRKDTPEGRRKTDVAKQIIGFAGTVFSALCCIGATAILSFLAAIGLGFLINDLILLPLLAAFLVISGWAHYRSYKRHRQIAAVGGALASMALVVIGIWTLPLVTYIGLAGLLIVSVMDFVLIRK